jgi:tetratricopeptide (TPR) repeat protein
MATVSAGERINDLIMDEQWGKARALIQRELAREPESHWLLNQLAETYYEQRQYKRALRLLLKSLETVPDCPMTLWHLAGTLDALGDHTIALRIFTWILEAKTTAQEDPCWESAEWTDALKTDCVYRIGVCFKHLHRKPKAEESFRRYVDLLLAGAEASYSIEEAMREIRRLGGTKRGGVEGKLRHAADWMQRSAGAATYQPKSLDWKKLRRQITQSGVL